MFTFQPVSTDERVAEVANIEQQIAESQVRIESYLAQIRKYMAGPDKNAPAMKDLVVIFAQRADTGAVAINPTLSRRYEFAVSDLLSRRAEPMSKVYDNFVQEEKLLSSLKVRCAEVRDSIKEAKKQNMLDAMQLNDVSWPII